MRWTPGQVARAIGRDEAPYEATARQTLAHLADDALHPGISVSASWPSARSGTATSRP